MKAARNSPKESNELAISYANASAALFHMKEYQRCQQCVQLALDFRYPKNQAEKLRRRLDLCKGKLSLQKTKNTSEKAFAKKFNCLSPKSTLTTKVFTERSNDLINGNFFINNKVEVLPLTNLPGEYGVVARKTLVKDEPILIEKSFLSCLNEEYFQTNCYHCLKKLDPLFFYCCRDCTQVLFCHHDCEQSCWSDYHQFECKSIDLFKISNQFNLQLKLCIKLLGRLWQISAHNPKRLYKMMIEKNEPKTAERKQSEMIESQSSIDAYEEFCNLIEHPNNDKNDYSYAALLVIAYFLENLTQERQSKLNESQICHLKRIFCKHIRQVQVNALTVCSRQLGTAEECDLDRDCPSIVNKEIGIGLYLKMTFVNHSCVPNAIVCGYDGNQLLIRSSTEINVGEQVCFAYGVDRRWQTYEERQKLLQDAYFFTCGCLGCVQKLQPTCKGILCPKCKQLLNCKLECKNCGNKRTRSPNELIKKTSDVIKMSKMAMSLADSGDSLSLELAERMLREIHAELDECLHFSHTQLRELDLTLRKVYVASKKWSQAIDCSITRWKRTQSEYTRLEVEDLNCRLMVLYDFSKVANQTQKIAENEMQEILYETIDLVEKMFAIEEQTKKELLKWLRQLESVTL